MSNNHSTSGESVASDDSTNNRQQLLHELERLRLTAGRYHILLNILPHGVLECDAAGRITLCNPAHYELTGRTSDQLMGKFIWDCVEPSESTLLKNSFEYLAQHQPDPIPYYTASIKPSGERLEVQIDWDYIRNEVGDLTGYIAVFTDQTEKRQAEYALEGSEKRYRDLFENSKDAHLVIEDDRFIDCNQAALDMLGYQDKKDIIFRRPSMISPEFQPDGRSSEEKANEILQQAIKQGGVRFEWEHLRANGDVFPVEVSLTPLATEQGKQIVHTVWHDISIQKQQREKIIHQAHFDNLTELPNRFLSLDRLEQQLNDAKRRNTGVAVLFVDLDDFKKVNDTLGHEAGDRVLIEASHRLDSAVRSGDTVGRLGGDEFLVLLGGLNSPFDAAPVANNLLEHFQEPFVVEGRELLLTASIGIACYPEDGTTVSDLLRRSDTAMYHSKNQGRNTCHFFTEAMNASVSKRRLIEEQLHGALDREEFGIHYQPLIDTDKGRIVGAEALLRWSNPVLGDVSPEEFIPIAEQMGHIIPLGRFVFATALSMLSKWQEKQGSAFKMSINFSPRQFRDPDLIGHIADCLQRYDVQGESVELEITEGALLSAKPYVREALEEIKALGIGIAMDDFGTGYSSMSYLRQYPFDTLKIDKSFVSDLFVSGIVDNSADRELIQATIALAHGLGLEVIAEGVEQQAQFVYLQQQGCEFVQGNYFSEPVNDEAFAELLESNAL